MPTRSNPKMAGGLPRRVQRETPSAHATALRLAIGPEGVGLELAQPARLGCVKVTDLCAIFSGLRFPADVSGGVARFRHRRGHLARLALEISSRGVERWLAPKLRGILGGGVPDVWVGVAPAWATICVSREGAPESEFSPFAPALAFDVHALAEGDAVRLIVTNARGTHLPLSPTALAIGCLEAALTCVAHREGAAFVIGRPLAAIATALFPDAGARVPATSSLSFSTFSCLGDTWLLQAARGSIPCAPTEASIRAREIAILLRDGDDALVAGDVERARSTYLSALDRAPRHVEIVRRIVEIDARTKGREEAALAGCRAPTSDGTLLLGTIRGDLLAAAGDVASALAALEHEAEIEPSPVLSSRVYERAASLAGDPLMAAQWLDLALARAPRAITARWRRVAVRLLLGRTDEALSDAGHIEALASSATAKHAVWLRAGRAFARAGLREHAGSVFERALRYAPEDASALAGVGEGLIHNGAVARGISALLAALERAHQRGEATGSISLALAQALADHLNDLPAAIARLAGIPPEADEAIVAGGLEGRWRAKLGDLAGASLAFARMRHLAASFAVAPRGDPESLAVTDPSAQPTARNMANLLVEAAQTERSMRADLHAAERHLALALRLQPEDAAIRSAHSLVADEIAQNEKPIPSAPPARAPSTAAIPTAKAAATSRAASNTSEPSDEPAEARFEPPRFECGGEEDSSADVEMSSRADELTRRVQADPSDEDAADELASVLEALGRGHELLALLSGRLEDATGDRRALILPRVIAALDRLAIGAERLGRHEEAALYRNARGALDA